MSTRKLGQLKKGEGGRIVRLDRNSELASRMLEMGLLEGARVTIVHEAPFGGDPLAVRVRGGLIALRRNEADLVEVAVETESSS